MVWMSKKKAQRLRDLEAQRLGGRPAQQLPQDLECSGEWETHPCVLPTEVGLTHLLQVYSCDCGRRWRLMRIVPRAHVIRHEWAEMLPGSWDVTDEQIESFFSDEGPSA